MEEEAPPPSATLSISASVSFDSSPAYPPNAMATKALKVCPVRHAQAQRSDALPLPAAATHARREVGLAWGAAHADAEGQERRAVVVRSLSRDRAVPARAAADRELQNAARCPPGVATNSLVPLQVARGRTFRRGPPPRLTRRLGCVCGRAISAAFHAIARRTRSGCRHAARPSAVLRLRARAAATLQLRCGAATAAARWSRRPRREARARSAFRRRRAGGRARGVAA